MTTKPYTEKQLFDSLISQSVYGVWIALGKIQNPMTNEMSVELTQASIQIDMLDIDLPTYEQQKILSALADLARCSSLLPQQRTAVVLARQEQTKRTKGATTLTIIIITCLKQ